MGVQLPGAAGPQPGTGESRGDVTVRPGTVTPPEVAIPQEVARPPEVEASGVEASGVEASGVEVPPVAWRGVLGVACAVGVALVALAGRYGYHRDELYFRAAGAHLGWGYVDQPALVPLLGRASTAVFGDNLVALRIPAALCTVLVAVLAALVARELGGRAGAQVLAAAGSVTAPYVLASGHMLSTGIADLVAWLGVVWTVLRVLRTGRSRWWLLTGLVVGVGMHAKHLVVMLVLALAVALLLVGPRRMLRNRWLWAGAALALVVAAPNLVWQATHGWPQVQMARSIARDAAENRVLLLPFQAVLGGVVTLPVWVAGMVGLLRDPRWRRYRAIAVAYPVTVVLVLLTGGQYYYPAALLVVLLAAGFVRLQPWLARPDRRVLVAGLATVHVGVSAVLSLPLLPRTALRSPVLAVNETGVEQVGWQELAAQVGRIYQGLPQAERAAATVFTANYGEAGALDRFGGRYGLPKVHSGHNSYHDWGPPPDGRDVVIVVGREHRLLPFVRNCSVVAQLDNDLGVDNEERGAPIRVCRGMSEPWSRIWPRLRHVE